MPATRSPNPNPNFDLWPLTWCLLVGEVSWWIMDLTLPSLVTLSFSRFFCLIVLIDRQTKSQTEIQTRMMAYSCDYCRRELLWKTAGWLLYHHQCVHIHNCSTRSLWLTVGHTDTYLLTYLQYTRAQRIIVHSVGSPCCQHDNRKRKRLSMNGWSLKALTLTRVYFILQR